MSKRTITVNMTDRGMAPYLSGLRCLLFFHPMMGGRRIDADHFQLFTTREPVMANRLWVPDGNEDLIRLKYRTFVDEGTFSAVSDVRLDENSSYKEVVLNSNTDRLSKGYYEICEWLPFFLALYNCNKEDNEMFSPTSRYAGRSKSYHDKLSQVVEKLAEEGDNNVVTQAYEDPKEPMWSTTFIFKMDWRNG